MSERNVSEPRQGHKRVSVPTTRAGRVSRLSQIATRGHYTRTGHILNAVYAPTGDLFDSVQLIRLCCQGDA